MVTEKGTSLRDINVCYG